MFNQLQGVANGTGPNPALAEFNQATGQNVANQAALMAGQRGAGANAGLLARLASMQGANTQQQAAGQAATMQAQQQLGALNQLGGIAGQQVGQQQAGITGLNQAAQGNQNSILGAINNQNANRINMQSNINSANGQIANTNAQGQQSILGGALGGAGLGAMKLFGLAEGGSVPGYADGGAVAVNNYAAPQSFAGKYFNQMGASPQNAGSGALNQGMKDFTSALVGGFASKPQFTAEQAVAAPSIVDTTSMIQPTAQDPMLMGAPQVPGGQMMSSEGGKVPGKAEVKGDSYANDTVSAKLSPGEIVIPRSVLQGKNPVQMAAKFVEQEMLKQKLSKKNSFASGGTAQDDEQKPVVVNVNPPPPQGAMASFGNALSNFSNQLKPLVSGQEPNASFNNQVLQPAATSAAEMTSPQPAPAAITSGEIAQIPQQQIASNGPMPAAPASAPGLSGGEMAQQVPSSSSSISNDQMFSGYGKAASEQKMGAQKEAAAVGEQGRQEAAIAHEQQAKLQQQQQSYQENYNALNAERNKFQSDLQAQHIDPKKYLGDMSTGQKFSTAIGLILGGIGGGLMHQENPALKYLNSQMENDINAQKANMDKQNNLLSMNMKQFGNLNDATNMTRLNMADMAKAQLQEAAGKAADPLAKARALKAVGEIDMAMAPIQNQMAMRRAALSGGKNDVGTAIEVLADPKQKEALYKEYGVKQETDSLKKLYQEQFNHLKDKALNGSFSPADRQSAIQSVAGKIQKATEGRYNLEAATQLAQALFPNKIESGQTTKNKYARGTELLGGLSSTPQLDTFMKMHGIANPSDPYTQLDPQQKKFADWAQANPNDPKAKIVLQKLNLR